MGRISVVLLSFFGSSLRFVSFVFMQMFFAVVSLVTFVDYWFVLIKNSEK